MSTRASNARHVHAAALGVCAALALTACTASEQSWEPPESSFRDFQVVYPVLLRDCGFHACHGAKERFYRVYGPGRARLDPDTQAFDGVTGDEASASYTFALSMIDVHHPEQSLLLRKPLAVAGGGSSHGGVDRYGRDVYRTVDDAGYVALEHWVSSVAKTK